MQPAGHRPLQGSAQLSPCWSLMLLLLLLPLLLLLALDWERCELPHCCKLWPQRHDAT